MRKYGLILKFSLQDLNDFAPDGVKFMQGPADVIRVVPDGYSEKYPNIENPYNIFNTGLTLKDLDVKIGEYISLGDKKLPIGFESATADEIMQEKFIPSCKAKAIFKKDDVSDLDMKSQLSGLGGYGYLTNRVKELSDQIYVLDIIYKNMVKFEPKKLFTSKAVHTKWKSEIDWVSEQQQNVKNSIDINRREQGELFYHLEYRPNDILYFTFKQAAKEKIQSILNEIQTLKNDGKYEKLKQAVKTLNSLGVYCGDCSGIAKAGLIATLRTDETDKNNSSPVPWLHDSCRKTSDLDILLGQPTLTPHESKVLLGLCRNIKAR